MPEVKYVSNHLTFLHVLVMLLPALSPTAFFIAGTVCSRQLTIAMFSCGVPSSQGSSHVCFEFIESARERRRVHNVYTSVLMFRLCTALCELLRRAGFSSTEIVCKAKI